MKRFLLIALILFLGITGSYAQCCSMGSPFSGSVFSGILPKNTLRVSTSYKYGYFETYYHHHTQLNNFGAIKNSRYSFGGMILAFGVTKRITLENEIGYFFNKQQHYNDPLVDAVIPRSHGFSNGVLNIKYGVYVSLIRELEFSVGAGMKYPLASKPMYIDNVKLPVELQPSTGAFGFVGQWLFKKGLSTHKMSFTLMDRFEINGQNSDKYQYGNSNIMSLTVSKILKPRFTGVVQFRDEYRLSDKNGKTEAPPYSEGSHLVMFTPQLSYAVAGKWIFSVSADVPLYRYYMGSANYDSGTGGQISSRYAFGMSLIRDFNLGK